MHILVYYLNSFVTHIYKECLSYVNHVYII